MGPRRGRAIRVDVSLVLLDATVKDKAGRVMGALKQEDFVLDEDGVPQQVAHFSRDQLPLAVALVGDRSEEHTSELQSRLHLVCRLLLEKKKKKAMKTYR